MVRVKHKGPGQSANGPLRGAGVGKQRKKQKMEIVSHDKDKKGGVVRNKVLLARRGSTHGPRQISFTAQPPPGYTFIPAGNPQLTAALKEAAKRGNQQVYAVTV